MKSNSKSRLNYETDGLQLDLHVNNVIEPKLLKPYFQTKILKSKICHPWNFLL